MMEQKINVPYDSSGGNFPNPRISVNNVYNCDAFPWPKNTVLIGRVSKINDINKKSFSTAFRSVKVRSFSDATIDDMYDNLISLLTASLVLHMGTNKSPNEASFQIYDKLLTLVHFIKETTNCHTVLPLPIDRLDDVKATLTIRRLNG